MSAKLFWQTLLVWRAARTMLGITSRFLRHIWNWSGTSPASSRQWWLSFQATPLPLSVSPLWGQDGCQREGTTGTTLGTQPERGSPKEGHREGVQPPGAVLTATGWLQRAPAGRAAQRRQGRSPWLGMAPGRGLTMELGLLGTGIGGRAGTVDGTRQDWGPEQDWDQGWR